MYNVVVCDCTSTRTSSTWVDGLAHGVGKEVAVESGEVYEGNWKQGQRHGDGAVIRHGKKRKGVWDMGARTKWTRPRSPLAPHWRL
jgi:hypothetical protein